jgi:multiple sugar transport system substrate-binding protein
MKDNLTSPRRALLGRPRRLFNTLAATGLAVSMATIGTNVTGAPPAQASSTPITVLVDSLRLPMVKAYEKAHPGVKLDIELGDAGANGDGSIESKVALANRVGHGWPDIVFSAEANDVQKLGVAPFDFPAVLNQGLVSNSIIKNYAKGALAPCMIGGKLECLRNDLAFDVLWVNVPLMHQWGYTVPTTWQEWQTIGLDVAKNHPGYVIGSIGDSFDDSIYLQAAQCPINDELSQFTLLDNPNDPHCTGMGALLDPLLKAGALSTTYVFASTFPKQYTGKVLMMVGPAWYSGAIFDTPTGLNAAKGTIAAYPPLQWAGSPKAWTGDVGGGLWIMSSHASDPQAVAKVLVGLATSTAVQDISAGYPGYVPAAKSWIAEQDASGFWATPLAPAFAIAANEVWPGWAETPWDVYGIWASTVLPNLTAGQSFSSQLPGFAAQISDYAQSDGFQVVTKP